MWTVAFRNFTETCQCHSNSWTGFRLACQSTSQLVADSFFLEHGTMFSPHNLQLKSNQTRRPTNIVFGCGGLAIDIPRWVNSSTGTIRFSSWTVELFNQIRIPSRMEFLFSLWIKHKKMNLLQGFLIFCFSSVRHFVKCLWLASRTSTGNESYSTTKWFFQWFSENYSSKPFNSQMKAVPHRKAKHSTCLLE